jgi:predicted dinucleotide-binding enzyme
MALEATRFADNRVGDAAGGLSPDRATSDHEPAELRLGIVGAGKLGTTIARAAIEAGYDVAISSSGPANDISLTVEVLAPGAVAATTDEVVRGADIIVLAVPTHRFRELPPDLFTGKLLVDAMNYWEPVDGIDEDLAAARHGTSIVVRDHFPTARVVKSLNQLGYHELEETRRPKDAPDRIAIGVAGDDRVAVRAVMRFVDRLGFDPVDAGPLENGLALQPDGSPYATSYTAAELSNLISESHSGRPASRGGGPSPIGRSRPAGPRALDRVG